MLLRILISPLGWRAPIATSSELVGGKERTNEECNRPRYGPESNGTHFSAIRAKMRALRARACGLVMNACVDLDRKRLLKKSMQRDTKRRGNESTRRLKRSKVGGC